MININKRRWSWLQKPRLYLLPLLSGLATSYCIWLGFVLDMGVTGNIAFASIFFTFAITLGTANRRRFDALDELATLKSNILSFADVFDHALPPQRLPLVMDELRTFFPILQKTLSQKEFAVELNNLRQADQFFSNLIKYCFEARENGLPSPEVSRLLQWHQSMRNSIERILAIKEYNTPLTLRRFIHTAMVTTVLLLSPEFASMGWIGIVASILVTLMVQILSNIQEMIEDPFGEEVDDIHFEFIDRVRDRLVKQSGE